MRDVTIEFVGLTKKEMDTLFKIEDKMKVSGAVMTGSGFHIPTRTRDWRFNVED